MAELKIIFKSDSTTYEILHIIKLLKEPILDSYTEVEGVLTRSFNSRTNRLMALGGFMSLNYETNIGNFSDFNKPIKLETRFGPECVFGIGLNSGDRNLLEHNLSKAIMELELLAPGSKRSLEYVGILHGDSALLYLNEEDSLIKKLL